MGSEEQSLLNELAARSPDGNLLDADNIPNENQSLTCFSCDQPMVGLYCAKCGNKNDNYRRSVWSLGVELFQSMTAFENRMLRSLWSLIANPGRMGREYADGARQRWTSPIRMFLATSLLIFGYVAVTGTQMIAFGELRDGTVRAGDGLPVGTDDTVETGLIGADGLEAQKILFFVQRNRLETPDTFTAEDAAAFARDLREDLDESDNSPEAMDEALARLDEQIANAQSSMERTILTETRDVLRKTARTLPPIPETGTSETEADATPDGSDKRPEMPAGGPGIQEQDGYMRMTGWNGETIELDAQGRTAVFQQILRHPEVINNELNAKLKWAMFFMMPLAMILGAIFIRGRDTAMLYDHAVHAAYVHSFSFLLLFVFILLVQFTPVPGLFGLYCLILLIYLPLSARGMFRRGWFKSILTAYGVGAVYTLVVFTIAVMIVVGALQTVVADIAETREAVRAGLSQ